MANRFTVQIKTSASPAWVDISNYVRIDWGSPDILVENGYGQITSGRLSFSVEDRDNAGLDAHHWLNLLATSTTVPEVRVYANYGDTAPPQQRLVFYGYLEPGSLTMEGDCVSAFTALTLLGHADRLDMYPARNGQSATTQTSALAEDVLTVALRKLGCAAGSVADVVVRDYKVGSGQTDADWNHSLRQWANVQLDIMRSGGLGDFVPAYGVPHPTLGFVLRHGRLYRVDDTGRSGVSLTEVLDSNGQPYTTTGQRLHRFVAESGQDCLCVVEAVSRQTYTRSEQQWAGWSVVTPVASLASLAAALLFPGVGTAALLGTQAALWAGQALTKTQKDIANPERVMTATGFRVLSIGNGSNGSGGVGRAIDRAYTLPYSERSAYAPVDSFCAAAANNVGNCPGEVYCLVASYTGSATALRIYWNGSGFVTDVLTVGSKLADLGRPAGGAAARSTPAGWRVVFFGFERGVYVATEYLQGGERRWRIEPILTEVAPARFCACLMHNPGGGDIWDAHFLLGNGSDLVVKQRVFFPGTLPVLHSCSLGVNRKLIVSANTWNLTRTVGREFASAIVTGIDSDQRQQHYAGAIYLDGNDSIAVWDDSLTTTRALPLGLAGDWRPPVVLQDTEQGIYRYVIPVLRYDRYRYITDWVFSSLYAVARIHWDFQLDRMSIGDTIREACRSFNLYCRVLDPTAPTSASQVRIISRHAWTPPFIGTLAADNVAQSWRMAGIEFYDGAVAEVEGQRIAAGTIEIGKTVYQLGGQFLSRAWARAITAYITSLYPRRSTTYPYGRRIFTPAALEVDDGENLLPPGYADLMGYVRFTFPSGVDRYALVQGVGIDRPRLLYPLRLLEYGVTGGIGDGVTWQQNEPAMTLAEPDYSFTDDVGDAPAAASQQQPIFGWEVKANVIAPQSNPSDAPCVYALRIHLPHGLNLAGYGYSLTRHGLPTDGNLFLSVWSDVDGRPGLRYDDSRAVVLSHSESEAGWNVQNLNWGAPIDTTARCWLPAGTCWLVVSIDTNSAAGITAPPLDWWNGVSSNRVRYYELSAGHPNGMPTEPWPATDAARSTTPAIYLIGEV